MEQPAASVSEQCHCGANFAFSTASTTNANEAYVAAQLDTWRLRHEDRCPRSALKIAQERSALVDRIDQMFGVGGKE